jgi:hypothetical protein
VPNDDDDDDGGGGGGGGKQFNGEFNRKCSRIRSVERSASSSMHIPQTNLHNL